MNATAFVGLTAHGNAVAPTRLHRDERTAELAHILAAGIERWRASGDLAERRQVNTDAEIPLVHSTSEPNGASMPTAMEGQDNPQ